MEDKKFRKALEQYAQDQDQEIIMLDNPYFDKSVVGVTYDGRLVYDYDRMIQEYAEDEGCDEMDAIEFIDYNTMRAIPYMGENAPIVIATSRENLIEMYGDEDVEKEDGKDA